MAAAALMASKDGMQSRHPAKEWAQEAIPLRARMSSCGHFAVCARVRAAPSDRDAAIDVGVQS